MIQCVGNESLGDSCKGNRIYIYIYIGMFFSFFSGFVPTNFLLRTSNCFSWVFPLLNYERSCVGDFRKHVVLPKPFGWEEGTAIANESFPRGPYSSGSFGSRGFSPIWYCSSKTAIASSSNKNLPTSPLPHPILPPPSLHHHPPTPHPIHPPPSLLHHRPQHPPSQTRAQAAPHANESPAVPGTPPPAPRQRGHLRDPRRAHGRGAESHGRHRGQDPAPRLGARGTRGTRGARGTRGMGTAPGHPGIGARTVHPLFFWLGTRIPQ